MNIYIDPLIGSLRKRDKIYTQLLSCISMLQLDGQNNYYQHISTTVITDSIECIFLICIFKDSVKPAIRSCPIRNESIDKSQMRLNSWNLTCISLNNRWAPNKLFFGYHVKATLILHVLEKRNRNSKLQTTRFYISVVPRQRFDYEWCGLMMLMMMVVSDDLFQPTAGSRSQLMLMLMLREQWRQLFRKIPANNGKEKKESTSFCTVF